MSNSSSKSGGISFAGALFLIFLVLKLTGLITWSWWWVTAPLWGGFAIFFGIIIIVGIIALLLDNK
jgi:hypothetical protein